MSNTASRVKALMENFSDIDSILITDIENIFYLSNFTGSNAILFISDYGCNLITDSRYTLQASMECPDFNVIEYDSPGMYNILNSLIEKSHASNVGFEAGTISYRTYLDFLEKLSVSVVPTYSLVENLRLYKDLDEIEIIKEAARLIDKVWNIASKEIKAGMTEWELAVLLEENMRRLGASKIGFDSIVAAGNFAACPHHSPTQKKIELFDMVKCDFGCILNNYNADITRTVFMGDPDKKFQEIYNVVLEAQLESIAAIKPGMLGKDIDKIARDVISKAGYGKYFGHSLGHSMGINVHDGPGFSPSSNVVLKPGFVGTVEPGIYIPGWGGVRIEDDIIVTETGCEVITNSPK